MAYYARMDDLDEFGKKMREFSKENIKTNIDNLLSIKDQVAWSGIAKETFFDEYETIIKKLYGLSNTIDLFGFFFQYVSGKYMECKEESQKEFLKFLNEMEELENQNATNAGGM